MGTCVFVMMDYGCRKAVLGEPSRAHLLFYHGHALAPDIALALLLTQVRRPTSFWEDGSTSFFVFARLPQSLYDRSVPKSPNLRCSRGAAGHHSLTASKYCHAAGRAALCLFHARREHRQLTTT